MNELLEKLAQAGADPQTALSDVFISDESLYLECLKIFPSDTNMRLLRDSLARGDSKAAIRAAHTLKGIADNLGLLPVVDAAYSVLSDLRSGKTECVGSDMIELEGIYKQFTRLLEG